MSSPTLAQPVVLADLLPRSTARSVLLVIAGACLTGLAAQLSIHTPLSPVPFTFQTFAVLTTGAALGPLLGICSMTLYVAVGSLGVPWFADHASGFGGPTFGYLLGFIAAAGVAGILARHRADRHVVTTLLMVAGSAVIYVIGSSWLAHSLGLDAGTAYDLGVRPFLATDALKIVLASLVLPTAWKLTGKNDRVD